MTSSGSIESARMRCSFHGETAMPPASIHGIICDRYVNVPAVRIGIQFGLHTIIFDKVNLR